MAQTISCAPPQTQAGTTGAPLPTEWGTLPRPTRWLLLLRAQQSISVGLSSKHKARSALPASHQALVVPPSQHEDAPGYTVVQVNMGLTQHALCEAWRAHKSGTLAATHVHGQEHHLTAKHRFLPSWQGPGWQVANTFWISPRSYQPHKRTRMGLQRPKNQHHPNPIGCFVQSTGMAERQPCHDLPLLYDLAGASLECLRGGMTRDPLMRPTKGGKSVTLCEPHKRALDDGDGSSRLQLQCIEA